MSNRLAKESSPYLLQHAENPVDWYSWGPDALHRATDEDKPIFLSIGYSACHWCHVMEHESFEDEQIAQLLNDNFVSIKVDREERPDLDQIYMNAVMALRQGQGGWPLSVFLTPQQEVFYGGTYWPPRSRMGMPGFDHVLHSVLDAFVNRREQIQEQSQQITAWLNHEDTAGVDLEIDNQLLVDSVTTLQRNFDAQNGGFGGAPKFPHAMDLSLLVRLADRWPEHQAPGEEVMLEMVRISLKKMAYGGIFDHLAGGFARYSVDEHWLVPHFEKMLYDNALLAGVYLDMFDQEGDQFHAMIARKTLDYLLNYMTDEAGCFHSTEDADSEGVEGKFYVWSRDEIIEALGDATGSQFCDLYNVTEQGNFEGQNILNMRKTYQQFADLHGIAKEDLQNNMRAARKQLLEIRDKRVRPAKDDKVLVSWNALAVSSMARAAVLLNEARHGLAARNAAVFILENLRRDDGRLLHTWRLGQSKQDAFLDDYSYLIVAMLDLYNVDFDQAWIARAADLTRLMIEHFAAPGGGFFFTADDQEQLISRPISFQDSSVPSGNSMAAMALLRLGRITGNTNWIHLGRQTIVASAALLKKAPMACGQMFHAVDMLLNESCELVVAANDETELSSVVDSFRQARLPFANLICRFPHNNIVEDLKSMVDSKEMVGEQTTLYVCKGFSCSPPISGLQKIESAFQQLSDDAKRA